MKICRIKSVFPFPRRQDVCPVRVRQSSKLHMIKLSRRTEKLLEKLFPDVETKDLAGNILVIECGDNIPFCKDSGPEEMERIRFSVIKLSNGDLNKLGNALELALIDARDLFMSAGFGKDVKAHMQWYQEIVES